MIVRRKIAVHVAVYLLPLRVTQNGLHFRLRRGRVQSEQHIRSHAEYPGKRHNLRDIRQSDVVFPLRNRLGGHPEQLRERFLCQILLHAQPTDRLTHRARVFFASIHDILSSFLIKISAASPLYA